jgi:hypothetical protein
MKKLLLTSIAALFLVTGAAHSDAATQLLDNTREALKGYDDAMLSDSAGGAYPMPPRVRAKILQNLERDKALHECRCVAAVPVSTIPSHPSGFRRAGIPRPGRGAEPKPIG